MKIEHDIKQSDLMNIGQVTEIGNLPEKEMNETLRYQYHIVQAVRHILTPEKVKTVQPVKINEMRRYINTMQMWIENNFDYPVNRNNRALFEAIHQTLTSPDTRQDLIGYIAFTYPEQVRKVLDYNTQSQFVDHPAIDYVHTHLNPSKYARGQQPVQKQAKAQKDIKTLIAENNITGEDFISYVQNRHQMSNNQTQYYQEFKACLENCVAQIREKTKAQDISKEVDTILNNKVNRVIYSQLVNESLSPFFEGLSQQKFTSEQIVKTFLMPSIQQLQQEQRGDLESVFALWQLPEEKRLMINQLLNDGEFLKQLRTVNSLSKREPEGRFYSKMICRLFKFDPLQAAENYKTAFQRLAFFTKGDEKFKQEIDFLQELGFDIHREQQLAIPYKDKIIQNGIARDVYRIAVFNHEGKPVNPIDSDQKYHYNDSKKITIAEGLSQLLENWQNALSKQTRLKFKKP